MFLLIGIPSEPPLAMVGEQLRKLGTPFEFVNQRNSEKYSISLEFSSAGADGVLLLAGREVRLSNVVGVYNRATDPTIIPEMQGLEEGALEPMRALRFHFLLSSYLETSAATVVNRLRPMGTNASKPYQLQLIQDFFRVPETLITNDAAEVRDFLRRFGVIYKSVSGERSIVMDLRDEDFGRLDVHLQSCPVQFQRKVQGVACRAHVVGSKVYACSIETDGLDYRYARQQGYSNPKLAAVQLPGPWEDACRGLTRSLGLEFSGIDFVVDSNAVPWCLEVNTCPAYSYFEAETGQPIAKALACHLAGNGNCGCGCA